MAFASLVSITVTPVLMLWFLRGRIHRGNKNFSDRLCIALYKPILNLARWRPWTGLRISRWMFVFWKLVLACTSSTRRECTSPSSIQWNIWPTFWSAKLVSVTVMILHWQRVVHVPLIVMVKYYFLEEHPLVAITMVFSIQGTMNVLSLLEHVLEI